MNELPLNLLEGQTGPEGAPVAASIIVLHGLGADGNDFVPIARELDLSAIGVVRYVFPSAPVRPVSLNNGYPMPAWYDIFPPTADADILRREDEPGLRELAIHDEDRARRDALVHRLASLGTCRVVAGSNDPTGFDVAINATPVGMKAGDPHPIDSSRFTPKLFVGCVITAPAVPPMIAAARAMGCNTLTGADMFAQVKDLMVAFLMGE